MKRQKGFTLIEVTITLAILGIALAVSAVVISTLTSASNRSNELVDISNDTQKVNDIIDDYVSFISVKSDDLFFSFSSISDDKHSIVFKASFDYEESPYSIDYVLSFENSHIKVTNNYSYEVGYDIDYLKYESDSLVENISSVSFSFKNDLEPSNLLIASIETRNRTEKYSYILRINYEYFD